MKQRIESPLSNSSLSFALSDTLPQIFCKRGEGQLHACEAEGRGEMSEESGALSQEHPDSSASQESVHSKAFLLSGHGSSHGSSQIGNPSLVVN